jgi:hypothetical protein
MVLVRKTELACRNGWDDDLWEPRDGSGGSGTVRGARKPASRIPVTESHDDASSWTPVANPGTDVVIASGERDDTPGRREQEIATNAKPQERGVIADRAAQDVDAINVWSSAFQAQERESEAAVDELQHETISPRFGSPGGDWQGQLPQFDARPESVTDVVPVPNVLSERDNEYPSNHANGTQHAGGKAPEDAVFHEQRPVQQSGVTEQFDIDPASIAAQGAEFGVQGVEDAIEVEATLEEGELDDEVSGSRSLPMLGNVNPCCRNCRDFLPSKDGTHGWCNNPFAFEKRQEVRGDTVTCQSTFGNWWSPSDDWWMERADIAHHSAPTPLVDNLIRQIRIRQIDDEGSTEVRDRS